MGIGAGGDDDAVLGVGVDEDHGRAAGSGNRDQTGQSHVVGAEVGAQLHNLNCESGDDGRLSLSLQAEGSLLGRSLPLEILALLFALRLPAARRNHPVMERTQGSKDVLMPF